MPPTATTAVSASATTTAIRVMPRARCDCIWISIQGNQKNRSAITPPSTNADSGSDNSDRYGMVNPTGIVVAADVFVALFRLFVARAIRGATH